MTSHGMRSVLITGGSGFFGRAFVHHLLANTSIQRICIYSRGEHAQAAMRDAIHPANHHRMRFFVGDVRDPDRLRWAMDAVNLVVHAAALKRIEVGAYNPDEMVKTNVLGTMNVVDAATRCGVAKVILVSSDKAYQPVSPYGLTKALAESLVLSGNNRVRTGTTRFAVCRYGNVAGSTGSVIPRWRALIAAGATHVPVTDPECTRFWMTVEEAAQLVAHTADTMAGGEINVPHLHAYRLGVLAEAMGVRWNVIGLPGHEKKHEAMREGLTSDTAPRMSVKDLKEALKHV